ncbi:hypothetical protein P6F26_14515 [Roseibacterium sp. SDUM158017]|uniref:hypothetical protein n=1 Tax=Roseicyclus salinarum TaxID=3036773 RepID=UPI002414F114|nr:hypothetical protein [Roseibacterium sp. SDUM158017]MDG4649655.1 hypothetical protein [Roseibacterium sp. SDUM158017]
MRLHLSALVFAMSAAAMSAAAVSAQEAPGPGVSVELNRIDQLDGACRLTFMVENGLGADLAALSLETVLIDAGGVVERLTLFEFGALPAGTPRVRQFDIPGLSCDALGRVLINGVAECGGAADCADALRLRTRTDVEVIG